MEIIHQATLKYKDDIIVLYIQSFPRSSSDKIALSKYIDGFLTEENAYLAIENSALKGALLYSPLNQDADLPLVIEQNFNIEKSVYIAEMMVSESSRGKGLGTELLAAFFENIDKTLYSDAFIRVWDQNEIAIGLYKKMGFVPYTQIDQMKNSADGSGTFIMKKIYLHKKL
jgi:diamine N-acetyltransferase